MGFSYIMVPIDRPGVRLTLESIVAIGLLPLKRRGVKHGSEARRGSGHPGVRFGILL